MLRSVTLTQLRSLSLNAGLYGDSWLYVSDFFRRHPTIEILHWEIKDSEDVEDFDAPLPSLTHLCGGRGDVLQILSGKELQSPLQSVLNLAVDMNSSIWKRIRPRLDPNRVRKLGINDIASVEDLYCLVEIFKMLEWLSVPSTEDLWDNSLRTRRRLFKVNLL